jgi:hypothetical protein
MKEYERLIGFRRRKRVKEGDMGKNGAACTCEWSISCVQPSFVKSIRFGNPQLRCIEIIGGESGDARGGVLASACFVTICTDSRV